MKKLITLLTIFSVLWSSQVDAQCDTTYVTGNMILSNSTFLSGVYYITGTFKVNTGATVFVQKYSVNQCGKLEIHATSIFVEGTINGDYAGFPGGIGGAPGQTVSSLTGDNLSLTSCSNKDNTGIVQLEGGVFGANGTGPGAGIHGLSGGMGSGPKQQCLNTDDEPGMIGGSGGAGGGSGGSYGGVGSAGGNGGAGSSTYSATGLNVSAAYPVVGGSGGIGGAVSSSYGTSAGHDVNLGSGGAGAGGGGRSFDSGLGGSNGGAGGGLVMLFSTDSISVSGSIRVNGEDGLSGGNGGNGGATPKCCSDGCDDCGEANLSTGAGAGAGSGAGSGGCIYIFADNGASVTGTLDAKGGNGGAGGTKGLGTSCTYSATFCGSQSLTSTSGQVGEAGGSGGGGRIKLFVPICSQATINPSISVTGGTGFASGGSGTYFLGCSELSLTENIEQLEVQIYPNPAEHILQISLKALQEEVEVVVVDVAGRIVRTEKSWSNGELISWDISNLTSGIYQVLVKTNRATVSKRFVKK